MELQHTLVTQQSPSTVFNYLARFHRVIEWDPSVSRAEKITPGKIDIGTCFEVDVQFLGATSTLVYQIMEYQSPSRLVLQGKADVYTVTDTITLESTSSGGTALNYSVQLEYEESFRKFTPLFAPLVKRNVAAAVEALDRTLNHAPAAVQHYPAWKDKLILPGVLNFTRRGYLRRKKARRKSDWSGLLFDLRGKTVVITGATSGLGKAATFALADMGANIIAVARNAQKAEALREELQDYCGANIRVLLGDMTSLAQTQAMAHTLLQEGKPIDVLINNAGALFNERQMTDEGLEKSLALLLLSPFVLTESLLPLLRASGAGRVINVVSGGLYTQPIQLDDLQYANESYNGAKAYARAKRGLLDMTRWWAGQAENFQVKFHAMHPGWADTGALQESLPQFHRITKPFLRNAQQGADTIVWLASAPEPATCNGEFWFDREIHTSEIITGTETAPEDRAVLRQRLCQLADAFIPGCDTGN